MKILSKKLTLLNVCVIVIAIVAIFYRTWDYNNRIYVHSDNARDFQVASYAKEHLKIPQTGNFSSAGPFFYGPWYYWYLEIISFLPFGFLTPWYAATVVSLVFIYLIYWVGKKVAGVWLGLMAAFYAAISEAQIENSLYIWNPSIIPILSLLSIVLLIKIYETKRHLYYFLLGFTVSLAFTIHFQAVLIFPTLLIALLLGVKPLKGFLKNALFTAAGFLIPLLPLIYFDARHNWYNSVSIFIFLVIDQYSIWVPNSWRLYLFSYWPEAASGIIGGSKYIIFLLAALFPIAIKKHPLFLILLVTVALELLMYRYYRGERFIYYTFFANWAVLFFAAWITFQTFKLNKLVGIALLLLISVPSIWFTQDTFNKRKVTLSKVQDIKSEIYSAIPGNHFNLHGCTFVQEGASNILAHIIYLDKMDSATGLKIGVCENENGINWKPLTTIDLLPKHSWSSRRTEKVYTETAEWWKTNPPQPGDFFKFLREKLSPSCYPRC